MVNRPKDIDATLVQLEILRRIPKLPRKIDAKTLHQQILDAGFERDLRSIQRTLKILCEHFDIECDERSKPFGYSWKLYSQGLALPILNEQQSLLLKLAEQQLKYLLPANLMSSMKPFFEQADKMVSGSKDKPEYQWLNKVCSTPTSYPLVPATIQEDIFAAVSQALFQNKLLHIEYQNQYGKQHSATIMPLAIAQQGASIYLVCRYEGFEDNRLLALHRLRKVEISTFNFTRPTDFDLKRYQEDGHLGFGSGDKVCLTFSITKSAGFHLTETPLSKNQNIVEETDEHYRIQAIVAENDMLEWWLRKFGEDIWDIQKERI
ncbi:helix-turn-helix transcriptional regulator [Mannheimia granulomatis]|uniref:helix-turn-helix transcriptional regulator n=1 Tax=Mannheimia granulomatis TaxID=85402 RepID=UPI00047D4205|nr:WYL domain-containing protein [Mannheimia granulomatis]QLB18599.1 WYL domain-containing protein [Mannheimia granulomatis]